MSDPDPQLVERIRSGDRQALASYIQQSAPQLMAFLGKRMSDRLKQKVEPADLLQELTISCLNSLETLELGDREPFSWLCQQAERRIIDAHRKHFGALKRNAGREISLQGAPAGSSPGEGEMGDLIAASLTSASQAFSRNQKEFHLLVALDGLPEEAREALKLRYLQGLASKEIAAKLGKTDGAIRVLLSRSLSKLQELLSSNDEFQTLLQQGKIDKSASDSGQNRQ